MDFLNLLWNFDADDKTKMILFMIIASISLFILVRYTPRKQIASKCQIDHRTCLVNVKHGNKLNNDCLKCKTNGDYPDQIYNSEAGCIKLDPKTGLGLE
jgi:hypothetical protein